MNRNAPRALLGAAAAAGLLLAAHRVVKAPPDPGVAARAEAAANTGPWAHRHVAVNGVRLHYVELGSGPLVILLHGFPECWFEWRRVLPRLAERYRVVAPDLRGYNRSAKPGGISSYAIPRVTADVVDLVEALDAERAYIVGHDWGGIIAWYLGMHHADRVAKLVIMNAPHPATYARELVNVGQLMRSWYAGFFQLPLLPEAALRLTIRRLLRASARIPDAFPDDALDVYEDAASQPGAATAIIDYYRAIPRMAALGKPVGTVSVPTLVLWGMQDAALSPRLLDGLEPWVPDLRVERFPESSHWLPEEQPAVVAERLLRFFA
jgi:epoxide hydrolase 4